jgi:hypothetical protein
MQKPPRFLLFLYSTRNMAGSALGIAGLLLFFTGVIQQYWLLIVIGLYAIGVLAAPKDPQYDLKLSHQLQESDIREGLEGLVHKIRGKVPKEILERVLSIKGSILEVLPQIMDLSSSDRNIFLIQQTALDYLPGALEGYLNLPRAYANLQPLKDGKTARQLLLEQLDLLDTEMEAVVQDVYRNDAQQLIAHGRFLQDKFSGGQENWLV